MLPGKNRQFFILAGIAVTALLIIGVGSVAAYGILFQPVWTERLPFLNSTGQFDVITIYRNATDVPYANLTGYLDGVLPGLQVSIAMDPGYRCVEYAVVLHDDAQRHGINCSVLGQGGGVADRGVPKNALVAFLTTDSGMVYVDPTAMNVSAADYPGMDFSRVTLARDEWNVTPWFCNAMGLQPSMTERRQAETVSFSELELFLAADQTEERAYDYPNYTCLDFAVDLHNRAEAGGIKCGVVAVGFIGPGDGHAFNAFPTTDRGMVYIDCTGINQTEQDDGAVPTDNVVYLLNGSELGELPLTQVNRSLDYEFYLDRKDRIEAYRQQWKQYAADVGSYNAEVDEHDAQLAANNEYYAAYSREFEEYEAAVTEYNLQMETHNSGVMLFNEDELDFGEISPAPTNHEELEAWAAKLDAMYDRYLSTWNKLEAWRLQLNMQKSVLDVRLNALRNTDESKWITFGPMGIVEDINVYWG
jgi:hypothetical protein